MDQCPQEQQSAKSKIFSKDFQQEQTAFLKKREMKDQAEPTADPLWT